jgi:hypothetical protein
MAFTRVNESAARRELAVAVFFLAMAIECYR